MSDPEKPPIFMPCGMSPFLVQGGGHQPYAMNLAHCLHELGYEVFVVAHGDRAALLPIAAGFLVLCQARVGSLPLTVIPHIPLYGILFARAIERIVRQRGDRRFVVWGIGPWSLAGARLKRRFGDRMVLISHFFQSTRHDWRGAIAALEPRDFGMLPKTKYLAAYWTIIQYLASLERQILRASDIISTNHASTERDLQREFGVPTEKFRRTTFVLDLFNRTTPPGTPRPELPERCILFLSRQAPKKGVNYLFRALDLLRTGGLRIPLVIAGAGEMDALNRRLATRLGLASQVTFLGHVHDPLALLRAAAQTMSVFCLPSTEEGAGAFAVDEAMAAGLPIVATGVDGVPEDLDHGVSGLLVPPRDPKTLAHALRMLWEDPTLARELGRRARERYARKFSVQDFTYQTAAILDEALAFSTERKP